jgi:hypothetical protein
MIRRIIAALVASSVPPAFAYAADEKIPQLESSTVGWSRWPTISSRLHRARGR